MNKGKLVLFGAGKIGRSFIGQLFSVGGYEVVFVDVYQPVIDALNAKKEYRVIIKSDKNEEILVNNLRAVQAANHEQVVAEIASADILAVSIGQQGLPSVIELLAQGLLVRNKQPQSNAIDLIIAENLRDAAEYFRHGLAKQLPANFPIDKKIGLVETSIGKMVPIMLRKDVEADPLQVFAEPYNTLIVDKMAFLNPIPDIAGLSAKANMKAWVDRKLFIHNLGHATAAYLGYVYNPNFKYIYEVLDMPELKAKVRATMLQAADILLAKYPAEFTVESLTSHVDDLLHRFANRALGDTIFRVGCDLKRKLSPDDRLLGAIHLAYKTQMPCFLIEEVVEAAFQFKATDENGNLFPGDLLFLTQLTNNPNFKIHICLQNT